MLHSGPLCSMMDAVLVAGGRSAAKGQDSSAVTLTAKAGAHSCWWGSKRLIHQSEGHKCPCCVLMELQAAWSAAVSVHPAPSTGAMQMPAGARAVEA